MIKNKLKTTIRIFQGYYGCASGKARQNAKTEIEKLKVSYFCDTISVLHYWVVYDIVFSVIKRVVT